MSDTDTNVTFDRVQLQVQLRDMGSSKTIATYIVEMYSNWHIRDSHVTEDTARSWVAKELHRIADDIEYDHRRQLPVYKIVPEEQF